MEMIRQLSVGRQILTGSIGNMGMSSEFCADRKYRCFDHFSPKGIGKRKMGISASFESGMTGKMNGEEADVQSLYKKIRSWI